MKFAIFVFSCINVFLQAFSIQLLWNAWLLPTFPITFAQAILAPILYSLLTTSTTSMLAGYRADQLTVDEQLTMSISLALVYTLFIGVAYMVKAFM